MDQPLRQDATGTLVMLELEAMDIDRVQTEVSAQYVDHNLIQEDFTNSDDHLFVETACRWFGVWYSRPGNGVSSVHSTSSSSGSGGNLPGENVLAIPMGTRAQRREYSRSVRPESSVLIHTGLKPCRPLPTTTSKRCWRTGPM